MSDERARLIAESLRIARERGILSANGKHDEPGQGGAEGFSAWQPLSLLAVPEPLREVVAGFVRPGLVVVFGAPGSLKSLLLADLVVCAAVGRAWLEPLAGETVAAKRTTRTRAVWLDTDNGALTTQTRLGAVLRAYSVTEQLPVYAFSLPNPPFLAADNRSVVAMRDLLRDYGAGLLVVDNLANVAAGADENGAEMVRVMANLRWLAEQADCCVVLIHHQRKANGTKARAGETLRGHGSIEAALDLALLVERDEKQKDLVTVTATKCRHAQLEPFGARFAYEGDGTVLRKARFFGCSAEAGVEYALRKAILEAAQEEITQSELVKAVQREVAGAGRDRIRALAEQMAREGELRKAAGKKGAILYSCAT